MRHSLVRYMPGFGWEVFRKEGWRYLPLWGAIGLLGREAVEATMLHSAAPAMLLKEAA